MAQLKAGEVDRFLSRSDSATRIYLVYGPDRGLVSERTQALMKKSNVDLADPFSMIHLDMEEIASDPPRLADEANSIGMFGGERLIRITGSSRKDVSRIFKSLLETPPQECWIIIEAGDLKKGTGLRKQFENSPSALAIPCYQDNEAALNSLIKQVLGDHDLLINRENELLLRSLLGGDRQASRGELEKLALYTLGAKEITEDHIRDIVGDASSLMLDEVIDSVSMGNCANLQKELTKLFETGTSPDMLMMAALRHFQILHDARTNMEKTRKPAQALIAGFRPPIHFSRRDKITRTLTIWPSNALSEFLSRFNQACLDCRKNQPLAQSICGTTLLATALKAKMLAGSKAR